MKKHLLSLLLLMTAVSIHAQLKPDYYNSIDNKRGRELKMALYSVVKPSTSNMFNYGELWEKYPDTDFVEGQKNTAGQYLIFDYYSTEKRYFPGNGNAPSGMNKEHVAPQGWWGGGTPKGPGTDLFQVLPSDGTANNRKSNYPLGVVTGTVSYSNPRMKTGRDSKGNMVFEPCDEYKGDFARIYFYDAVVWYNTQWQNSGDVICPFTKQEYPTINNDDFLKMLLQWNEQDPVSEWEMTRQERVYKLQKNRNPFIDYPSLANYIWNENVTTNFLLAEEELHVITPVDPVDPVDPIDPIDPIDPVDPVIAQGDTLFFEPFDDCSEGNSYNSSGSSKLWNGNDRIVSVSNAYQAGGAVKLGTSSKTGGLSTCPIPFDGGTLIVKIWIKGWTNVEGTLGVSVGSQSKTATYTAKMGDDFEEVTLTFTNVPANPTIDMLTSAKRCFIDAILVMKEADEIPTGIQPLHWQAETNDGLFYDLTGRRLTSQPTKAGIYIHNGRKVLVR